MHVTHGKIHAEDCGEGKLRRIDRFERPLDIEGDLDETAHKRLIEFVDHCPLHKALEQTSTIVTKLKELERA